MNERLDYLMDAIRSEVAVKRTSIKALSEAVGVSYPAMRRYLKGERAMNLAQLYCVADALKTTATALIREAERREDAYRDEPGRTDGRTDRPTDRPTDHSSRNARRKTSAGQLELSARSDESATDDLSPEVIEALAKSETARIIEHEQVKRDGVTKSRRRSAS